MTAEPTFSQLRAYHRTVGALLADPECIGDLLLVGLWLARAVTLRVPEPGENRWSSAACAREVFQPADRDVQHRQMQDVMIGGQTVRVDTYAMEKVHRLLTKDRPHYDRWLDDRRHPERHVCGAPMSRRAGLCGGRVSTYRYLIDPDTGRQVEVGACLRHRRSGWYAEAIGEWQDRLTAAGDRVPAPPANTGGVLQRHIRGLDWDGWWRQEVPDWTPPADDERAPGRPQLTLLTFEPAAPPEPAGRRSRLGVVDGGA